MPPFQLSFGGRQPIAHDADDVLRRCEPVLFCPCAPPQRSSQQKSDALRSTSSTARARAVVSSRNRRLELTVVESTAHAQAQLFDVGAPDNETDAAPQTGSWNIPHFTSALLHLVCIRVAVVLCHCVLSASSCCMFLNSPGTNC